MANDSYIQALPNSIGILNSDLFYNFPVAADVRLGIAYGSSSVGHTSVGTLDLPVVADVKDGVMFDGGTKEGEYAGGGGAVAVPKIAVIGGF